MQLRTGGPIVVMLAAGLWTACTTGETTSSVENASSSGHLTSSSSAASMGSSGSTSSSVEASSSAGASSSSSAPGPYCGDGQLNGTEECDDSNMMDLDGCSAGCLVEAGWACVGLPSQCTAQCGDGLVVGPETCDDDNTAADDGCSSTCTVELGFTCAGMPSQCDETCGDGFIVGEETCDDLDTEPGDGCSDACTTETGWICMGEPSTCGEICGDGLVVGAEGCDDDNSDALDGCSDACTAEPGYTCTGAPSSCITSCGDGVPAGAEQCDDDNRDAGDGCSDQCMVETGYLCSGAPSSCAEDCGDGLVVGGEECDDEDSDAGDGCSDQCRTETGFVCTDVPSTCAAVCGDGLIVGTETCDDLNLNGEDGCSDQCALEAGYRCTGVPSTCSVVCGDGMRVGNEVCDDGNTDPEDGCSSDCLALSGESCAEPWTVATAVDQGVHTWTLPAGTFASDDGEFACDPNTHGPDVVLKFTKTTADLANGGQLLHVRADTPATNSTGSFLNLEIRSGGCALDASTSLKCLWYKDNWDAYLDVPAGEYWIWVGKNSPATSSGQFPQVTVTVEEVPPAATEGESCAAPYTSLSANYTPPNGSGMPHTWLIPPTINSFDMGTTWGEPTSISCDNHNMYGDIHGVDAVIEFEKMSATSVLQVQVLNLDPTLAQSDLNVELLADCQPGAGNISRNCRANTDAVAFTAPAPAGPQYLWVSTEATAEEFGGASVQITEIFPGPGESWGTAMTLGTNTTAITPTSSMRLDAPGCFPATGNVHWYVYTAVNDRVVVSSQGSGFMAVQDAAGQLVGCLDAAGTIPAVTSAGDQVYVAVLVGGGVTHLNVVDISYTGVRNPQPLNITFPSSLLTSYGMAVNNGTVLVGNPSDLFAFPSTGNATAVQHGTSDGITSTHLGHDLVYAGGGLFSVDSTTSTTASRLYRLFDGTTWAPTAWDQAPTYPSSSPAHALATDGSLVLMATRNTSSKVDFYSFIPMAPNAPVHLGTNTQVRYVVGLAADSQYFYVTGTDGTDEGVFRISRSNVSAAPTRLATLNASTVHNSMALDAGTSPSHLYVRAYGGAIHAIANPGQATPIHLGVIADLGNSNDLALAYDQGAHRLYFTESETVGNGAVWVMTR